MGPSWGSFFLQLGREVCSWTGILPCGTVFFGHILFRVLWEGKVCEGGHYGVEEELFLGGPPWINSAEKGNVFLSSIIYPCLWRQRKLKEWRLGCESFSLSEEICLCNSAVLCGTMLMADPILCGQVMESSASNYPFLLLLVLTFWIISISLSKGKIQGYKHSMYFLVIQFVWYVSKFMLGKIQTFGRKRGFQMSFLSLLWGCAH